MKDKHVQGYKKTTDYKKKYNLTPELTNRYCINTTNPTVQPDGRTEMGVAIPADVNVEASKEYEEENQL